LPCFQIEDLHPKSHCLSDSEFAILEGRDLENINFWNEIFGQELFACQKSVFLYYNSIKFLQENFIRSSRDLPKILIPEKKSIPFL